MPFHFGHILAIEEPQQIAKPGTTDEQLVSDVGPHHCTGHHDRWRKPRPRVAPMSYDLLPIVDNTKLCRSISRLI